MSNGTVQDSGSDECPVCYDDAQVNIKTILPCKHYICLSCLCKLKKFECVLCRTDFSDVMPESMKNKEISSNNIIRDNIIYEGYIYYLASQMRHSEIRNRIRRIVGDEELPLLNHSVDDTPLTGDDTPDY